MTSVFAGSNYRLGSCSTELVVSEIAQGLLPMGGLAHHLAQCCPEGGDGPLDVDIDIDH